MNMNAKQTIQIIIKIAPPLAVGALFFYALKEAFSGKAEEKKPEKVPEKATPISPTCLKSVNSGGNSGQKPFIPANPAGKTTVSTPLSAFPANSVPTVPDNKTQSPRKKAITRENMAEIFYRGGRNLDRKAAVAALMALGFGKSAAYEALSPDGRFSDSLYCTPGGIVTWKTQIVNPHSDVKVNLRN
jgi:hypothetical protein